MKDFAVQLDGRRSTVTSSLLDSRSQGNPCSYRSNQTSRMQPNLYIMDPMITSRILPTDSKQDPKAMLSMAPECSGMQEPPRNESLGEMRCADLGGKTRLSGKGFRVSGVLGYL